jgi:hypothetical protein
MKPLLSAWVYAHDNGDVEWTVRSHPTAEAMGLAPVISGGRIRAAHPDEQTTCTPDDVEVCLTVLAARLERLADSACWSFDLF